MSNQRIKVGEKYRDFTLIDTSGKEVSISQFVGKKYLYLVFNRGFSWPFCRRHMAQLRLDYDRFIAQDTEVIAVGPDSRQDFIKFWERKHIPFIGLADPDNEAAKLYEQEVALLKFGRVPAQMIMDENGIMRYVHYARSMADIPENEEILVQIEKINQ